MTSDGWNVNVSDVEPRPGPVDLVPETGHERGDHHREREQHPERDEPPPSLVRDAERDGEGANAEERPDQLAAEVEPAGLIGVNRLHRRRRQHHGEADDGEDRDDEGQRVERERRTARAPFGAAGGGMATARRGRRGTSVGARP